MQRHVWNFRDLADEERLGIEDATSRPLTIMMMTRCPYAAGPSELATVFTRRG